MGDVKILEETVEADPGSKWLTHLIEGTILLLAVLLGLAIRFGIYETTIVISKSMEPTVLVGDRLLLDHRSSLHHTWRRGDIVMFNAPESWGATGEDLIKRIVGMPGETVEVRAGQVLINGQPLTETYAAPDTADDAMVPLTIAPGQYFVMGDNRANSADSRINGPVPDRDIVGRAVYRLAPLNRFGALPPAGHASR